MSFHVCGAIRLCALRYPKDFKVKSILRKQLGTPIRINASEKTYESSIIPKGDEGALCYDIWENPDKTATNSYTISIFGDLGNYNDIDEIEQWLKKGLLSEYFFIGDGIIYIRYGCCVEQKEIILKLSSDIDDNKRFVNIIKRINIMEQ